MAVAACRYVGRIVKEGEKDAAVVKMIKERLNDVLALDNVPEQKLHPEDPHFGPKMTAAVKLFQTRYLDTDGLPLEHTGQVCPRTWGALFGADTVPTTDYAEDPFLAKVLQIASAQEEKKVREQPPNSNKGPEVNAYLHSVGLLAMVLCLRVLVL